MNRICFITPGGWVAIWILSVVIITHSPKQAGHTSTGHQLVEVGQSAASVMAANEIALAFNRQLAHNRSKRELSLEDKIEEALIEITEEPPTNPQLTAMFKSLPKEQLDKAKSKLASVGTGELYVK